MKAIVCAMAAMVVATQMYATVQEYEKLILDGVMCAMSEEPLAGILGFTWVKNGIRYDKPYWLSEDQPHWTSCGRGYMGTWAITNFSPHLEAATTVLTPPILGTNTSASSYLYLMAMEIWITNSSGNKKTIELPIGKVFKDWTLPKKAAWYSGTLRVPQGNAVQCVVDGRTVTLQPDRCITIEHGKVVSESVVTNRPAPRPY